MDKVLSSAACCLLAALSVSCASLQESEVLASQEGEDIPTASEIPVVSPQEHSGSVLRPTPIADGEADTSGLSSDQINTMFVSAFGQATPFAEHKAVCLELTRGVGGGRKSAPSGAIENFSLLTDLPVLPASQCAFDVFPYVIETGDKAMLYRIVVDVDARNSSVIFWAVAAFGNTGSYAQEFTLIRRLGKWHAEPTGRGSVS